MNGFIRVMKWLFCGPPEVPAGQRFDHSMWVFDEYTAARSAGNSSEMDRTFRDLVTIDTLGFTERQLDAHYDRVAKVLETEWSRDESRT